MSESDVDRLYDELDGLERYNLVELIAQERKRVTLLEGKLKPFIRYLEALERSSRLPRPDAGGLRLIWAEHHPDGAPAPIYLHHLEAARSALETAP